MKKLEIFKTKKVVNKNGQLTIFENSRKINFNFKRVFVVKSDKSQIRGKHAHKKCIQLLNCPNGAVEIYYETKSGTKSKAILCLLKSDNSSFYYSLKKNLATQVWTDRW